MRTEPSTPFSSGTEYENFIYYFCERCKKGKRNEDGFPEFPEEGGCPIWDAMENARFGQPFPSDKIVRLVGDDGEIQVYNCCTEFDAIDEEVAEAYKAKSAALRTETCEGADFVNIEVRRLKKADKYHKPGKKELDWLNAADRIAMVKDCGFTCDFYARCWENCADCPAKEFCDDFISPEEMEGES